MAKISSTDPTEEVKEIISNGKKRPLNFAMMKSKEGVVLKAHVTKSSGVMLRECKVAGGLPAMQVQGLLSVRGKLIEMTLENPDVSDTLAKLAKKYFATLGIPCKIVFLLPSGARLGEGDDEEKTTEAEVTGSGSPVHADDTSKESPLAEPPSVEASQDKNATGDPAEESPNALKATLLKEIAALSPQLEAANVSGMEPLIKKVKAVEGMFHTTIEQNPKKARGVLALLIKTLEKVPGSAAPKPPPIGGSARMRELDVLEKSVDDLLAEFA
jgi:hypothetical protein